MADPLPPLNALRAFEATARHLSFSRAAEELHVTPAALSHQIKGLEEFLNVKLFLRKPRAIELTDAGRTLYPGIHQGFGQLRQAVQSLDRLRNDHVLVVSAPPGFTAKWLAPRLHRFVSANPQIETRISSTSILIDFVADGVDVILRNAAEPPASMHAEKLVDIYLLAVASPRLIEAAGGITKPEDLLRLPLIHDDSIAKLAKAPYWPAWFAAHGINNPDLSRGLHFNSADHALEAAIEGAGVSLTYRTLAYDDLRVGRLVAPFETLLDFKRAFYIACESGSEDRPKIKAFRDWVRSEMDQMVVDCEAVAKPGYRPASAAAIKPRPRAKAAAS